MTGQPNAVDARHRLDAAVRTLTRPYVHHLRRDDPILDSVAANLVRDDRAVEHELEQRHARLLRAGHNPQAARVLAALIDHRRRITERTTRQRTTIAEEPALLEQLLEAVGSSTSGPGEGAGAASTRSVIGLAAAQLVAEIRAAVGARRGDNLGEFVTLWSRTTAYVENAAELAEQWVSGILELLNPEHRWTMPGACPDCNARTVHVDDGTGQVVRTTAIELDADNERARCRRCPAKWVGEEQLRQLAKVLEQQQKEPDRWNHADRR